METSKCRSCGRAIVFATTERGKIMPVDVNPATVFKLRDDATGTYADRLLADEEVHIAHFSSCPNAAAWSKTGRRS